MDKRLNAFLRVIDPEDNATGGGAASAVAGAMAAALVGMVARVSIGKKNLAESDAYYAAVDEEAQSLSEALLAGSNADSEAFDQVMAAFRMTRQSEMEKAARAAAIQAATAGATGVPLQNAEKCARALEMARRLLGRSNPHAASDLECAMYLAEAGLKGALSNAEINISSLKDEAVAAAFSARLLSLRE